MNRIEELHHTIRRNIHVVSITSPRTFYPSLLASNFFGYLQFQEDPGPAVMLILYSAILTRGINQYVYMSALGNLIKRN